MKALPHQVALGIYASQSLFNHSCVPNIIATYDGSTVHVRAMKNIRKGEELVANYGPRFGQMQRDERRNKLRYQYNFDCACVACALEKFTSKFLIKRVLLYY